MNAVLSNGSKTAGPIFMLLLPGRHYAYEAEFLSAFSELGFELDVENPVCGTSFSVNKDSVVTGGAFMARVEYALPSGYTAIGDDMSLPSPFTQLLACARQRNLGRRSLSR
jgi:hypothetical protein